MIRRLLSPAPGRVLSRLLCMGAAALALASVPAWALYKVVGPDGRVTYTDRPPSDRPAVSLKANGASSATAGLPFELKRVADRYPVVLYTAPKCAPCDAGRQLLSARGIPFTEKTVETAEDLKALQKLEGTEQVPILRVGSKQLQGLSSGEWASYLDAAGYPPKSALPPAYKPAVTPLTPRAEPTAAASGVAPRQPASPDPAAPPPAANPASPPGFRF